MRTPAGRDHLTEATQEPGEGEDRYADILDAVERIVHDDDFPSGPVERLLITCTASGEVMYKAWGPRAEDPHQGYWARDAR